MVDLSNFEFDLHCIILDAFLFGSFYVLGVFFYD